MKTCQKCKNQNDSDERYCGLCRNDFAAVQTEQNAPVLRKLRFERKRQPRHLPFFYWAYRQQIPVAFAKPQEPQRVRVIIDRGENNVDSFTGFVIGETTTAFRVMRKADPKLGLTAVNELFAKDSPRVKCVLLQ